MALITDAPRIYIDEELISGSASVDQIAALAELSWTWGRSSIYDKNQPATLRMQIIDPTGSFASRSLTGLKIRIGLGDNITVLRGRINDQTAELVELTDEAGHLHKVWLVTINAADRLAEAAQAVLPGPYNDPLQIEKCGNDYWTRQTIDERIDDIMSQGGYSIVARILYDNPYPVGSYYPRTRYRPFGDQQSVLDMLELIYSTQPLTWVNYNAGGHQIEAGKPAESAGLALDWDGSTIDISLPGGRTVYAGDVAAPDGLQAETTIEAGIDAVQVTVPQLGPSTDYEIVDNTTQKNTARNDPDAYGRKILSVVTDVFYNAPSQVDAAWQEKLAIQTRNAVDQINGKLKLPTLRFHTGMRDYPHEVLRIAMDTHSYAVPFYFPGSVFNTLQTAGAAHQIIGGTVTWHGSKQWWTADCTVAPALSTGTGITIGELVQHAAPQLDDFADYITLADLGNVTEGVAA